MVSAPSCGHTHVLRLIFLQCKPALCSWRKTDRLRDDLLPSTKLNNACLTAACHLAWHPVCSGRVKEVEMPPFFKSRNLPSRNIKEDICNIYNHANKSFRAEATICMSPRVCPCSDPRLPLDLPLLTPHLENHFIIQFY